MRNEDPVFRRDIAHDYPSIDRAEGCRLYDTAGRAYIDGAGGIFVVNIGPNVADVVEAMARQAARVAFAHTAHFTSDAEIAFARRVLELAPAGFSKAWLCTSGSQANETAVKLARTYHLLNGDAGRVQVVSRWNSYHGSSLGALSLTGHTKRREQFIPYLFQSPKIEPPYCYRCPFGQTRGTCGVACADDLDATVRRIGPDNISAFIVEPVSGGPLGAVVPPEDYFPKIREICNRHGMLMIVDEVITGAGRTGTKLGIDHFGVTPDIITLAKGIGGGYVPIGAVLVHERVYQAFESHGQPFRHGETFTGHPVTAAAGVAVLDHLAKHGLIARAQRMGAELGQRLQTLLQLPVVGDIRGIGLLWGIEIVRDRATKAPFARALTVAEKIARSAFERGLIVVPGVGCADGENGDTLSLAPPFIVTEADIAQIVAILHDAISSVAHDLGADPH